VIVIDASVLLDLVLIDEEQNEQYAQRVLQQALSQGLQIVAPRIITSEVTYQLLKQGRRRRWGEAKTAEYAELLDRVPIRMIQMTSSMASLVRYAWRHNVQGYDAQYIATAEYFKAPLASLDKGQRSAARAMGITLL
jgi:predicted nucleic acid-binding protein